MAFHYLEWHFSFSDLEGDYLQIRLSALPLNFWCRHETWKSQIPFELPVLYGHVKEESISLELIWWDSDFNQMLIWSGRNLLLAVKM